MLNLLSILVIGYVYLAISVFIFGTIYVLARWLFIRKGPTGTYLGFPNLFTYPGQDTRWKAFVNILGRIFLFTSMKRNPYVRATSLVFHWSLWIIILAHADIVLFPYMVSSGIPESTMEMIGAYVGTTFNVLLLVSGVILLLRRITDRYLRKISNMADFFAILIIVAIGFSGLAMRIMLPPDFAYAQASPFILSLSSFSPINLPSSPLFTLHVILTMTLFLYFPLPVSKFMHPYSFFTNPTLNSVYTPGEIK